MGRAKGKTALVTGAASGIGRGGALALAREGAKVVIGDINEESGTQVVREIAGAGGEAAFLQQDVRSPADWERVAQDIRQRHGRLDILVNNAGGGHEFRDFESETLEGFRAWTALNLDSAFLGVQACLPLLRESRGLASVINIASAAGMVGETDLFAYSCAKAGVVMLSRLVAMHALERGYRIRCNAICPGLILTPLLESLIGMFDINANRSLAARLRVMPEERRIGEPTDVGNLILFLASDESRFVNGAAIPIDGGTAVI